MKKFLSLLLALLLCCGFIVSCEKEEAPLESESSSDTESSSIESSLSEGELVYDERGLPVFFSPPNAYTYYNVAEKEKADSAGKCYDTWVFDNYEAYCGFISQYAPIGDITESMFDDSFIVVVYRPDDIRWTENYSYSNFEKRDGKYSLVLEYTEYPELSRTDDDYLACFDVVLIPRSECDAEPFSITVSIKRHIHRWEGEDELR